MCEEYFLENDIKAKGWYIKKKKKLAKYLGRSRIILFPRSS